MVPNALIISYLGFLFAAGAPAHSPSLSRALTVLNGLTIRQVVALLLGLLIISVATHPLQTPLIQLMEGYWWNLPLGPVAADHLTERFRRKLSAIRTELKNAERAKPWDWAMTQSVTNAKQSQTWLPTREQSLLPTALGNTLRRGETRAGERYGLELEFALPRLSPLLSAPSLAELRDRRNQLDAAVRLCIATGLATAIGLGLLLRSGPWLFLPLVTYLLCWACYRAAVAAARGFCGSLAAAIDLHHLQLFDALQLERPANLAEEFQLNKILTRLLRGDKLDDRTKSRLRYIAPKGKEAAPLTDESAD